MNPRINYLTQIIEKIGAPLLISILEASSKSGVSGSPEALKDEAQKMAELLSRTVLLSIDLGKMIEIEKSPAEYTESLRVAMAGLAGPMVASQYTHLMKPPAEADLKKLSGALEAVMTFSDNFVPSPENAARLDLLKANGTPSDAHQITIQYLQAFVPVADVIATFPFGQSEKKMMQDAADRINARAKQMSINLYSGIIDMEQGKLTELSFVRTLAEIYAHCHRAEMNTLMAQRDPDPSAQQKSLQTLWDNFDMRAAMLESLGAHLSPENTARAPAAPQNTTPPPAQSPVEAGGNPMSMFAKPKDDNQPDSIPPAAPPPPPPPQQPASQEAPPAPNTPEIPSENQSAEPQEKPPAAPSGNPMAFFKSPPQEGQGE